MAIFNKQFSQKSETVITPTFIPVSLINSILTSGTATDKQLLKLYLGVPELQAIINYKATAFSDMTVKAVNPEGNERDIPQLGVFAKPNPLQNFKEFSVQYYVLRAIFGNAFLHPVFPIRAEDTQALWNLPPMNAEIIPADKKIIPFNATEADEIIKEYQFQYNGSTITYQPDEIIHYNDNQVRFDDNEFLLGESKITPLVQACENIKSAYEARGVLIQNSALGILTNESKDQVGTTPLEPKDKAELHEDHSKYGIAKGKWQLIITNAPLKWQSMATDVSKLKLFEEVESDFRTIANAYSFPPELMQPSPGSSLNPGDKSIALKQLYQDAIIPEANEWLLGLSDFMGLKNITFESDFSHVPALQADLEKRSKTLNWAATGLFKAIEGQFLSTDDAKKEFEKYLL